MSRFDAVGFGALNVDKLFKVDGIAVAEEESSVIDYSETCGGSAANTVVGLARLGCRVGFIGKVACDSEGNRLLQEFRDEGVDTKGIAIAKDGRSGKVMGFVDRNGQRALYIDPGANDMVDSEDVNLTYIANTKLLHLTSFVGERSFQTQKWLLERLPKNVVVSFDPGALHARRGMKKLRPIIEKTSIMLPNAGELAMITGKNDYKEGADLLLDNGVKIVAVKLGSEGCYATDGKRSHLIAPFKIKVIDTTGAGDAFDAGFLYGLLAGMTLDEAAKAGNFVASRCVMAMGARTGLPTLENLKTNIGRNIRRTGDLSRSFFTN
jgi:ribokinase